MKRKSSNNARQPPCNKRAKVQKPAQPNNKKQKRNKNKKTKVQVKKNQHVCNVALDGTLSNCPLAMPILLKDSRIAGLGCKRLDEVESDPAVRDEMVEWIHTSIMANEPQALEDNVVTNRLESKLNTMKIRSKRQPYDPRSFVTLQECRELLDDNEYRCAELGPKTYFIPPETISHIGPFL